MNMESKLPTCIKKNKIIYTEREKKESVLNEGMYLSFNMQKQSQSNWCWAAVATTVGLFFNTGKWTQCQVANAHVSSSECCASPTPCNIYGLLEKALRITKSLHSFTSSNISLSTIKSQIDSGRPIGLRCVWTGGGAHFLVIYGYFDSGHISVDDSIYGKSIHPISEFPRFYHGGGIWSHTYYTMKGA